MSRLLFSIDWIGENLQPTYGSQQIAVYIRGNGSGTKKFKLDDGAWEDAQSYMGYEGRLWSNIPLSNVSHRIYYKDDNGERLLARVYLPSYPGGCRTTYSGQSLVWPKTLEVREDSIRIQMSGGNGTVTDMGVATDESATDPEVYGVLGGGGWYDLTLTDEQLNKTDDVVPVFKFFIEGVGRPRWCVIYDVRDIYHKEIEYSPISASYTKTNCTSSSSNDGTISLTVSGGSGLYSYLWNDGAVVKNRSDLSAGTYSVTITDTVSLEQVVLENIIITAPVPEVPTKGSVLEFPILNDLQFVVDPVSGDSSLATPDNVLLADRKFGSYNIPCYFQKVIKTDRKTIQFHSNFSGYAVGLYDHVSGNLVKSLEINLVHQNIGLVEEHPISIRNHTDNPGKSRVYFNSGSPPLPLSLGDVFEIVNNAEGFDGSYEIIDIVNDPLLGYQYLVINLNYTGIDYTSPATGRFTSNEEDYDVYESPLTFDDVGGGKYFVKVEAMDEDEVVKTGISEPIHVKTSWPNTNLVEYRNNDNGYGDIVWTTGYIGRVRIESLIGHKPFTAVGERTVSRNSNWSAVKVSARRVRTTLMETFMLPPYLHEKLGLIFDCDSFTVNGIQYQSTEPYADPTYIDQFILSNSSIRLEMTNRGYNSHDIGTVAEGGFLLTEQGFLKL